jgi:hypothetical protein
MIDPDFIKYCEHGWDRNSKTNREFLYVLFEQDGQFLKWYPKWEDVRDLIQASIITEGNGYDWHSPELEKFVALFKEWEESIEFFRACNEKVNS